MDTISSLAGTIADSRSSSPFTYASLVSYDSTTRLSTIKVLSGEINNVPKLASVNLGGEWEYIGSGTETSTSSVSISIPNRNYNAIELVMYGDVDGGAAQITATVNSSTIPSNVHRWQVHEQFADGSTSDNSGQSDGWRLGFWNHTNGNHLYARILRAPAVSSSTDGISWQMQSWSQNNATSTSARCLTHAGGSIIEPDIEIETLLIAPTSGVSFGNLDWRLWGLRPPANTNTQLLVTRRSGSTLPTIIGVLDGATTQES